MLVTKKFARSLRHEVRFVHDAPRGEPQCVKSSGEGRVADHWGREGIEHLVGNLVLFRILEDVERGERSPEAVRGHVDRSEPRRGFNALRLGWRMPAHQRRRLLREASLGPQRTRHARRGAGRRRGRVYDLHGVVYPAESIGDGPAAGDLEWNFDDRREIVEPLDRTLGASEREHELRGIRDALSDHAVELG
jgi:hypothetical protein